MHKTVLSFKNKQNTQFKIFFLFTIVNTLSKYRQVNVRPRLPEGANNERAKIK